MTASMVLALTACSTEPEPDDQGGDSKSLRGQTIKVLVSSGHLQFTPVWDKLDEFTAETGIKVELDQVGTVDIEGAFQRDVTVGACTYDNVEILDGAIPGAAAKMEDLGPYLERDGSSKEELLSQHVGWAEGAMVSDDQLKFYPFYSGAKAIAYRTDLFEDPANQSAFEEQYGYALPIPPTSPDQVVDLAEFFTGRGVDYGIVFSGSGDSAETTLADVIFRHGVTGYQDEDNNALWGPEHPDNQETVAQAATWLTDLIDNGYAPKDVRAMATGETTAFYTDGSAAMIYDHIYLPWAQFNTPEVTSKIGESGSFEPPNFTEDAGGITFYWGRGIPSCSDHKEASWEFMKWVMSEENMKLALTEGEGVFVPTDKNLLAWAVQENVVPEGVANAVENSKPYSVTTATGRIRQQVDIPLVEKLIGGDLSPEEYAQRSGEEIQAEAEESGLVE
jgi:multiple sugar transport system substrate-binding protein